MLDAQLSPCFDDEVVLVHIAVTGRRHGGCGDQDLRSTGGPDPGVEIGRDVGRCRVKVVLQIPGHLDHRRAQHPIPLRRRFVLSQDRIGVPQRLTEEPGVAPVTR